MGVFSELDMETKYGDGEPNAAPIQPFQLEQPAPERQAENVKFEDDAVQQAEAGAAKEILTELMDDTKAAALAEETKKREAHEAAEAKRKAEWEARQQAKQAAQQEQLARLATMSQEELMMASMKRVGEDTEKLTRRNMKECVSEYIQTKCLEDAQFALQVMLPQKTMIRCIRFINRKARDFVKAEMEDNDIRPENGIYGSDVPDDLCYDWAEEYFRSADAPEDVEKEDKFVPKPYPGGRTTKSAAKEKKEKKPPKKAEPEPQENFEGQISLLEAG